MDDKTFSARLLGPARRLRNRYWARRAQVGLKPAPATGLPEPLYFGDADRGAELAGGLWRVEGHEVDLLGGPIWAVPLPHPRLIATRETCGWLDDLAALGTRGARLTAQAWVLEWARRCGGGRGPGWTPETTGLRAMRWVAHAEFLTAGAAPADVERFWRALAMQQRYLARAWPQATQGLPRLRALAGLVWTGLVLPHDAHGVSVERLGALAAEAVGPEGDVGSRSPAELAETVALLIWTARLLENAGAAAAGPHLSAIVRAVPVLRQLRTGDGGLARFHGGGGGDPTAIDQALAELRLEAQPKARLPMGFARLTGARVVLLMDGAVPPRGRWAATAHAGALAFEMSVGRQPVVVNLGPGAPFDRDWARLARTTPAHSTVEVAGASSARFEKGALVAGPTLVSVRQAQDATGMWLLATHDGYVASHGLLHERRIFVDARGREARGEEILTVTDARARAVFDRAARAGAGRLVFTARFHIHPDVEVVFDPGPEVVALTLPNGEVWELRAGGGGLGVEDSVYLDTAASAPRPSRQVVVRAEVVEYLGQVTWSFGRIGPAPSGGSAAASR